MGKHVDAANNAKQKLELAKQKINECKELGNAAKNKVVDNKDALASGIIATNEVILKKCDDAIEIIETYENEIMAQAIELDKQLEAEAEEKKVDEKSQTTDEESQVKENLKPSKKIGKPGLTVTEVDLRF